MVADLFHRAIKEFIDSNKKSSFGNYPEEWRGRMERINSSLNWIVVNSEIYRKNCTLSYHHEMLQINACINEIENGGSGKELLIALNQLMKSVFLIVYEKMLKTSVEDEDIEKINLNELPMISLLLEPEGNISSKESLLARKWAFGLQRAIIQDDIKNSEESINVASHKAKIAKENAEKSISNWEKKISDFEERVEFVGERVEGIASKQNFVSLAQAFSNLIATKKSDLKTTNNLLYKMGASVLLPLVLSFLFTAYIWFFHDKPADELREKIIYFAPVLIPIEVILVYFFRIILKEQLSLKGQILQLELRYGVCEFIKGYADFVKGVGENKLDKFEALIFSGITPDPNSVPGTFDGLEQLAGLVQKFQK